MKKAARNPADNGASQYAVSAFTQELVDEVARNHYSLRAWRTLVSRSWSRSLEDIKESSARMRSLYLWTAVVAVVGATTILLTFRPEAPDRTLTAFFFWLPWFAGAVFFLLTHIGMVDDNNGMPQQSLLLPNGLSFSRLALAPLVLWPCLQVPVVPAAGPFYAFFLVVLSLSDVLDGWLARRRKLCTRMGRMLDVLADQALITFLAVGLYMAEVIPGPLLLLLVVRYPVLLIGVLIIYFVRGPAPLRPTFIGRMTTFATSIVLLAIALKTLLSTSWPTALWIEWSVRFLYIIIGANILLLVRWGLAWPVRKKTTALRF